MNGRILLVGIFGIAAAVACTVVDSDDVPTLTWADSSPPPMSRAEFDAYWQEISNWGRWGNDDQLGTLNFITPDKRREAAALVTDGLSFSMSLELDKQASELNENPFEHEVMTVEWAGHHWAVDKHAIMFHGFAHSHVDGLQHVAHKGLMYNGMPIEGLAPSGDDRLGIQHSAVEGIITRGVLVDLPRYLGVDYVPSGTAISSDDLEAWEKATGVTIGSGDVLLVRTGRWVEVTKRGPWNLPERATGFHSSIAGWLRERAVAAIGSDGVSDVFPSGVEGMSNPLHELLLAGMGMLMLDNLDLEAAADAAAGRNRHTFMFVGAPLRVPGGTGSPLNPLAVF